MTVLRVVPLQPQNGGPPGNFPSPALRAAYKFFSIQLIGNFLRQVLIHHTAVDLFLGVFFLTSRRFADRLSVPKERAFVRRRLAHHPPWTLDSHFSQPFSLGPVFPFFFCFRGSLNLLALEAFTPSGGRGVGLSIGHLFLFGLCSKKTALVFFETDFWFPFWPGPF